MLSILSILVAAATGATLNEHPVVEVYLPVLLGANTDFGFQQARKVVSEAHSRIGVRVVWRSITSAPAGCDKTDTGRRIIVTIRTGAPAEVAKDALAYSLPYATKGPCVMILADRVFPMMHRNPITTSFLLGHVLAHEIGHVLQGIVRHSDTGMMKANWSQEEIKNMTKVPLQFTPHDARLILDGLGFGGSEPN